MINISLVRIDERLLHGQVVTNWVQQFNIEQIVILNDAVRSDEMQQKVFQMSAPPAVVLRIFGIHEFGEIIKNNPVKRKTMLIFKTPKDVWQAIQAGIPIPNLNLGVMKFSEGKEQLSKAIFVDQEDKVCLKNIMKSVSEIYIQQIPKDERIELRDILN